jgi:hypothetical protein
MINSYCDGLKDTFAQLVYYGILKEEDAQCFTVHSSIESGSFILAAGAILLALLNTFVMKAVVQYSRDKDDLEKTILDEEEASSRSSETLPDTSFEDNSSSSPNDRIHPVPVLFTDTFRWTLRREDQAVGYSYVVSQAYGSKLSATEPRGSIDKDKDRVIMYDGGQQEAEVLEVLEISSNNGSRANFKQEVVADRRVLEEEDDEFLEVSVTDTGSEYIEEVVADSSVLEEESTYDEEFLEMSVMSEYTEEVIED